MSMEGFLMILWFFSGQLFGISFAKYTRAKQSTKIKAGILLLATLALTGFYYLS